MGNYRAYPPQQAYPPPQRAYPQQTVAQPPAYGPPPGPQAYPVPPQAADGTSRRRRRRSGCMWGCLGIVLVLILAVGGVVTWRVLRPPRSDNMQLGERVSLFTQSVDPSGGRLTLQRC